MASNRERRTRSEAVKRSEKWPSSPVDPSKLEDEHNTICKQFIAAAVINHQDQLTSLIVDRRRQIVILRFGPDRDQFRIIIAAAHLSSEGSHFVPDDKVTLADAVPTSGETVWACTRHCVGCK